MFVGLFVLFVFGCVKGNEECGILPPNAAERYPWQAGIYTDYNPIKEIFCTGTLITDKAIITVGHRFIDRDYNSNPNYFVAVGKFGVEWVQPTDDFTQRSSVKQIHLAPNFEKYSKYFPDLYFFMHNLAVMVVEDSFRFNQFIRPVCLDFDYEFEQKQLQSQSKGTLSGWKRNATGINMPYIKHLSYVLAADCIGCNVTDELFKAKLYLRTVTGDKLCIRVEDGTTPLGSFLDVGSGVVFPETVNGAEKYYLRGVYSGDKNFGEDCRDTILYDVTSVSEQESFIRKFWNESWSVNNQGQAGKCKLPPFPEHGSYTTNVTNLPATPQGAEGSVLVELTVTCRGGYGVQGARTVTCYNGFWPERVPVCVRMCPLTPHPSVEYRCLVSGDVVGFRACGAQEKVNTIVSPVCRRPHYFSHSDLPFMRCQADGYWDNVARCQPECGTVTSKGTGLAVGGVPAKRGELPWHVGVYMKTFTPYKQVCGGSLITNKIIISAAHCFWSELVLQLPAEEFAVAAGKLYRPWNDGKDDEHSMQDAQKSDVKEIHLPPRFQGAFSNFQDDLAVVLTAKEFQYRTFVRPVCLNFDTNFDRLQLQTVNKGKVAGWGLTAADGEPSPVLQVVELPYVEVGTCIVRSPATFMAHITSDKICAGTQDTSTALCRGDSGGGLTFLATDRDTPRYYLRGVVSTAPNDDQACNTATYTSFTHVQKHEDFIKQFLTEN